MTSLTGQFLLESIVVPAVVAGLVVFPARWSSHRVSFGLVTATAFLAAILTTYALIFDWPASTVLAARQKIIFLTLAATLLGLVPCQKLSSRSLVVLAIIGPLWIGWPALQQGMPSSALLTLPIIVGIWAGHRSSDQPGATTAHSLVLLLMAIGLALIALFARTFSVSQLSLALASITLSILLLGRQPPNPILPTTSAVMLSGLLSALLLYSDASVPALVILGSTLLAPALAGLFGNMSAFHDTPRTGLLAAMLLVALAVGIAWIDAGAVSVYEGAQLDGRVGQTFVLKRG